MTFDQFKKKREGKKYQESAQYGYQCVALVKLYASEVDGNTLWGFSWSAIKARWTGSPFKKLPYTRLNYAGKWIPPRWSILFFSATKDNPYGHTAIAGQCNDKELRVIEQNAVTGNGQWLWGDAISIRSYPYKWWKTGDLLGWYTCYMQY